jgi:hypothetical protein
VPVRVLLSAHTFANQALWDAIEKEGTHPVIYSARGTHAGWFSAGWQRHDGVVWDHCSKGQRWETWKADVASLFSWNPANPLPTTEDSEFTATSLHGADVPRWMRSNRYADRGQGDGSDPRDGAIYRWGNPATSWLDNVWLVDGPEGPLEKWEIWLPWTLG